MTLLRKNKSKIACLIISIFMASSPLVANADSTEVNRSYPCINKGSKTLLFQLGNPFLSGEETSYIFGFNYFFKNRTAIRFRCEGSLVFGNETSFADTVSANDTIYSSQNHPFRYGYYGLSIQYVLYKPINSHFNYFYGAGPSFSYHNPDNPYHIEEIYFSRTWDLGVALPFGVEWFPTEKLFLSAEYGLKMQYTEHLSKNISVSKDGSYSKYIHKDDKFEIKTLQFAFGVGIYF